MFFKNCFFLSGVFTTFLVSLLANGGSFGQSPRIEKILFGSCADEGAPQPVWDAINKEQADLFIFVGDNIYADTKKLEIFRSKYSQLAAKEGFDRVRQSTPIMAVWDDHDYGVNDGGGDFPAKEISRKAFLDFFNEPMASDRWIQESGIHTAKTFGDEQDRVQIILLDTRWNRSSIMRVTWLESLVHQWNELGPYNPLENAESTILGLKQWEWLDAQLQIPAKVRVIVSSIQVLAAYSGWEGWSLFPHEKTKLLNLIASRNGGAVVFLSGDRHFGELSADVATDGEILNDITSSGLNQAWDKPSENANRVGEPVITPNYGSVEFIWHELGVDIVLGLSDQSGKTMLEVPIADATMP